MSWCFFQIIMKWGLFMILVDIGSIIFAVFFFLLFGASIFDSSLQVYAWLDSNIISVIVFLILLGIPNYVKHYLDCEKKNIDVSIKDCIIELIAHTVFIASVCIFIKDMAVVYNDHPIIAALCTIPSVIIIAIPLLSCLSLIGIIDYISIAKIIVSVLLIVVSIISVEKWGTKLLLDAIFAFIVVVGTGIVVH